MAGDQPQRRQRRHDDRETATRRAKRRRQAQRCQRRRKDREFATPRQRSSSYVVDTRAERSIDAAVDAQSSERARERGSEGARERGSEGARERGGEGARERGSEGARERGSEGARERGSEGVRKGEIPTLSAMPREKQCRSRWPLMTSQPGRCCPSSTSVSVRPPSQSRALCGL